MIPATLIFSGKIIYLKSNASTRLAFPFIQIYKIYKSTFKSLLQLMWKELIYGQKIDSEVGSLLLFCLFLLLSLLGYYLEKYISIVTLLFIIIWFLDYGLAKKLYLKGKNEIDVTITESLEKILTWKTILPDRKLLKSDFLPTQVCQVVISQKPIYGGSFQELLGKAWQVGLNFWDGSELVIHESKNVINVVRNAKILAKYFEVPFIFQSSQGFGNYVEEVLDDETINNLKENNSRSAYFKVRQNKCHIFTKWNSKNSWLFIKQVFQESGFLLFVIVMTNFTADLGRLIHVFLTAYFQAREEPIIIPNILSELTQNLDLLNFLSLFFALSIIFFKGWQLSQTKHIYLDKYYLKLFINNQKIEQLSIKEIKSVLLMKAPDLAIIILGSDRAITIDKFQRLEDCQAFLYYIQAGLKQFQRED